ncbi:hypothetical protein ACQV5M_12230 [Leptospira sp. SA-E8]|uniref:hypothetical protein n=1 Tax=Leptospira sp. SA-E8 TaxID=3422259 RepID=UPI003EBDDCB9
MRKILLICLSLYLLQCTTTVKIITDPPGLDVYNQSQRLGKTPVEVVMPDGIFENYYLEFKKDRKYLRNVRMATEIKTGALVGAICFLFPVLWVVGPRPYQEYTIDNAFDQKAMKKDSALVVSNLPQGVEMVVGTKSFGKNSSAYIEANEYKVKLCDHLKCNDIGKHRFEKDSGYLYQLDSSNRQ